MKKKYLALAVGIILLSVYLYQDIIYYKIPFNPIKEYRSESLKKFYLTENLPNGEGVIAKSNESESCRLILEYLSELKLVPLKDNSALAMDHGKDTYLTGMLQFDHEREIFINDLFIEDASVLYISSSIPKFKKQGYYKIVDSTFDYNYIKNLLSDKED